jgi:hypothetical protein
MAKMVGCHYHGHITEDSNICLAKEFFLAGFDESNMLGRSMWPGTKGDL